MNFWLLKIQLTVFFQEIVSLNGHVLIKKRKYTERIISRTGLTGKLIANGRMLANGFTFNWEPEEVNTGSG